MRTTPELPLFAGYWYTGGSGPADANGNLTSANGNSAAQWDVENRLVASRPAGSANNYTYVYDPWGHRIWKQDYNSYDGTNTCEAYFYGATGQKLESYSCVWANGGFGATLQGINTYLGGKILSEKGVAVMTDRLGSVRKNSNGETFSYYPWGEERGQGTADGRTKFATYYRDMPGQDYGGARYYSAFTGSFWSADPKGHGAADERSATGDAAAYTPGLGAARLGNPLSWNRYAYGLGDPINIFDPLGTDGCNPDVDDTCTGDDSGDCGDSQDPCAADPAGGGDCPVDTCVTVSATADPVTFMGDDDDDDDDDGDTVGTAFSTTVTASSNSCVNASIAAGSLLGAGTGWFFGGGAGIIVGGASGSVVPVVGTITGAVGGASIGSAGGALIGTSFGGAVGGMLGSILCAEHTSNTTPSNLPTHEKGKARKKASRGPSSHPKYPPRKRPDGWKGPWAPKKPRN